MANRYYQLYVNDGGVWMIEEMELQKDAIENHKTVKDPPTSTGDLLQANEGLEGASIDWSKVVYLLWSERRQIAAVTLMALAVATAIAFAVKPSYTATASIVPPSQGSSSLSALAAQVSSFGGAGMLGTQKSQSDLYVGVLGSATVARSLIARFDLMHVYGEKKMSLAQKQLTANSSFVAGSKDGIIVISVSDHDPRRARDLANAYIEELYKANGRLALTEASQRRLFFEQQLAKEKNELEDAEVELKQTRESSGLIAPAGQTSAEIQSITRVRAQIAELTVQLTAMRQSSTEQNPDVVRLRSEIAELEGQLSRMQNGSTSSQVGSIPTSKVPALELVYVRKEREVKYHETLFEILSRQYESARMDEARDAPLIQVLDQPVIPDVKSGPKRSLYMVAGIFLGFVGGCGWVLSKSRHLLQSR